MRLCFHTTHSTFAVILVKYALWVTGFAIFRAYSSPFNHAAALLATRPTSLVLRQVSPCGRYHLESARMAETVGLVVGVVSFGVQLAESLQKVKRFYTTVKDAPERLADIIDEIGSLSDILTELEQDPTSNGVNTGPAMQRCVAACRKAVDRFSTCASSLESRMKRSTRLGSVKFAMKNESIESVIASLESSKSNLVLAYMMYREALAGERARLMQEQMNLFASGQSLLLQQRGPARDTQSLTDKRPEIQSHRRRSQPRLKTPAWLSRTVWEITMDKAISGWTFSIRSYSLIEALSPVTAACRDGDILSLQRSFELREASPFDEIAWYGTTYTSLLHVCQHLDQRKYLRLMCDQLAVMRNQLEVARLLIRYGANSLHPSALVSLHHPDSNTCS
jgi:hypothetical protein